MTLRSISILFAITATVSLQAEEIRISASDLLADYIEAPLKKYGEENGFTLKFESIGSLPAIDRLRSDEIDLAIIAVPEVDPKIREDFVLYPFAYDVAVIAVNATNPIDELSLSALGGIFGANEEYSYSSWGELGLSGWGSRSIKPLAGTEEESISLELFKYEVFKGGGMNQTVAMVKDSEVESLLGSDVASIALMSRLPISDKVKTVMIASSDSKDSPPFGPTEDNVHYGDYPIRLAFYIAISKRDESKMKPVLRGLFSNEIATAVRDKNLFSLPDSIRRKLTIDLDLEN